MTAGLLTPQSFGNFYHIAHEVFAKFTEGLDAFASQTAIPLHNQQDNHLHRGCVPNRILFLLVNTVAALTKYLLTWDMLLQHQAVS